MSGAIEAKIRLRWDENTPVGGGASIARAHRRKMADLTYADSYKSSRATFCRNLTV